MQSDELTETLREAQRLGFFGDTPIEVAIEHARQFVAALGASCRSGRVLDLGSGGGLPGLVLAAELPDAQVVLLDRRRKRTDFLERAVSRLGFGHVDVWWQDASRTATTVARGEVESFDAVTARGFGPPEVTLRIAVACVRPSGCIVISEPPTGDRWPPQLLAGLGLESERRAGVRRFTFRS